jgi:hypothetical protein
VETSNEKRSHRSIQRAGKLEVFDCELWVVGLAFDMVIENSDTMQRHGVKIVAAFEYSQAPI